VKKSRDLEALSAVGFVLDYLKDGPARIEDLYDAAQKQFGFTRWDVAEAGRHLALRGKTVEGAYYVYRCPNLVAIWWAKRPQAHRWTMAADRGSAA
jgi:hypothetical protein